MGFGSNFFPSKIQVDIVGLKVQYLKYQALFIPTDFFFSPFICIHPALFPLLISTSFLPPPPSIPTLYHTYIWYVCIKEDHNIIQHTDEIRPALRAHITTEICTKNSPHNLSLETTANSALFPLLLIPPPLLHVIGVSPWGWIQQWLGQSSSLSLEMKAC